MREIRKSLDTDSLQLAELLAARMAVEYKLAFIDMKKKTNKRRNDLDTFSTELIKFFDENQKEVTIDYGGDLDKELKAARELKGLSRTSNITPTTPAAGTSLSEAVGRYIDEQESRGLNVRSVADYQSMLRDFLEIHGDMPVADVTRESVVKAYSRFKQLPPNRKKMPEFRELSLQQILELNPVETVSSSTARKFVSRISQFFNWCVKWDMLNKNPASGLMEKRGNESTERLPFDDHDLQLIFGSSEYQTNSFSKSYQYWVPLIALFTGARLREICQLRTQDVVTVDGITCFNICPDAGPLKTPASERQIPVHSKLLELGLLELAERRKLAGDVRLFPELRPGREGPGQVASKWFARYRKHCGVTDSKKPFHSFRHTVWTQLSRQGCPDYEIDDLIGHESATVGSRRYRSKLLPKHLALTVEKLQFDIKELQRLTRQPADRAS